MKHASCAAIRYIDAPILINGDAAEYTRLVTKAEYRLSIRRKDEDTARIFQAILTAMQEQQAREAAAGD